MQLRCKLRTILSQQKMKQWDLAYRTGISQPALSAIINGRKLPSLETALRIAETVGTPVETIWVKAES